MVFEPHYQQLTPSGTAKSLPVGPDTDVPTEDHARTLVQTIESLGCHVFDADDHMTQALRDGDDAGSAPGIKLAALSGNVSSTSP